MCDALYDLACLEPEDRPAELVRLVRLVRAYPGERAALVALYCELALEEWWAATNPQPPCPPVDPAEAALSLARFRAVEAIASMAQTRDVIRTGSGR